MADPTLEEALQALEVTAMNFAVRLIRMAEVRTFYVQSIHEMSASIRAAVEAGAMSPKVGAKMAQEMRNEILRMSRARDFDLGRALAQSMKKDGIAFEKIIERAMSKLNMSGPFNELSGAQQKQVLMRVIESAGTSRPSVTCAIPKLRWAGRVAWLATFLIAGYNIGTAENPWWQSGREAAIIGGGLSGGFAGGAAMGAAGGVWAGPPGIVIGFVVGGILGALLADHAYVEVAGTSDPTVRAFVDRFTSFWTGTDEDGMAKALASEYRTNSAFVLRVFASLYNSHTSDSDDVAVAYVEIAKKDGLVEQAIAANRNLRDYLIELLEDGWTSYNERQAIKFLQTL
jgi:hypothetical protein